MKKKTVRFGIIGTGLIASTHAEALKRLGNAVLFMVYDRDLQKAEAFARRFECRFARTFAELLESSVEAVTIATPSGLHAQSAIPAARAGKHIFCEKPLDVSIEKAEEMIRACDENKVRLAAVYPLRFCDSVKWVRNMLDAGHFGTPVLAGGSIRWYRTPEYYASAAWRGTRALDGGGVLMNQGIHIADLLLHLNGDVSEVSAYTAKCLHRIEVEDTVAVSLRFRNGSLGYLEASTACAPGNPKRLELSGTRGTVLLEDDQITRCRFNQEMETTETIPRAAAPIQDSGSPLVSDCELHRRQLEDMADAILNGGEVAVTGREGLRALKLIHAVYESAESGRRIPME